MPYFTYLLFTVLPLCTAYPLLAMDPEAVLQRKLGSPEVELTSFERIAVIKHCAAQGAVAAAEAEDKIVCLVMGHTSVGKSTFINSLLGHTMQQSKLSDVGLEGRGRVVHVNEEVPTSHPMLEVGHTSHSTTFRPQLIADPQDGALIYCDCPGLKDSRGDEIDIANAIHVKQLMQRAQGLKVVFLMEYDQLTRAANARRSIKDLHTLCLQLFGNKDTLVDELTRHRDSLLLGITKAPKHNQWGEEVNTELISEYLQAGGDTTGIVEVLAPRLFLFDPLGTAPVHSAFLTPTQCRERLQTLSVMPGGIHEEEPRLIPNAENKDMLSNTIQEQAGQLIEALNHDNYQAMRVAWQSLQDLKVIDSEEVDTLVVSLGEQPFKDLLRRRIASFKEHALRGDFDQAQEQLGLLRMIFRHLAHENIVLEDNIVGLEGVLNDCRAERQQAQNDTLVQVEDARRNAMQFCAPSSPTIKLSRKADGIDQQIVKSDGCCVIS